ncbi:MAG TPA: response regulator [Methylomirabilota bacterium]|nr:response regulator [Methylomirabilota bacterium]
MNALSQNRRILLVDDNPAIHDLERILLEQLEDRSAEAGASSQLSGSDSAHPPRVRFEIDTALQGQQAMEMVNAAALAGRPYAMAFIDVRMPPGWDGVETTARIWERHPDLQVVLCTAFCDYSWDDMRKRLGESENLLILKKPFDNMEVLQLAYALTSKWNVTRMANLQIEQLDRRVAVRTQELQQSEERFGKAFRDNPLAMFIHSLHGEKILDANPAFLRLLAREMGQVIGRTTIELRIWPGEEMATADVLARTRETQDRLVAIRTSSGEERMAYLFTQHFDVGMEPCRLVLLEDVTERLKLEADLRQAHKMEAIGQLAAGVAHDFNNILTIVQGHISLVLSRNHLADKTHHALSQALAASERAGTLTRQLLAFSRKQVIERRALKLNSLFEQIEAMLERLIGEHIEVEFHCPTDLPRVFADRCNIEQVLINLAVNARDAMPEGGKLTISASEHTQESSDRPPDSPAGHFVCIRITDTGTGMDEATKARIFEPFFTTKGPGKGTGMGLATVYGILKQHQGWIDVASAIGQGTTFRIYLPISVELDDTALFRKPQTLHTELNGHETVLVVEDEELLLEFVQDVLTSHGYRVLSAKNAEEAVQIWDRESNGVALLLTDMVMPGGVTGKQLAEKLRRVKSNLRVIYSSGYSLDLVGSSASELGVSLLQKPYHASLLVKTVRECLDGSIQRTCRMNNGWPIQAAQD